MYISNIIFYDQHLTNAGYLPDPVLSTALELMGLILTTTRDRSSLYPFPDEETEAQTDYTASK